MWRKSARATVPSVISGTPFESRSRGFGLRLRSRLRNATGAAFAAIFVMAFCNSADARKTLTFAAVNTEEISLITRQWEKPLKYIGERLNVQFQFYAATSYAAVVEAMMSGFVDVALLAPEIYIRAREQASYITPINGLARPATSFLPQPCACYHALLITKRGGRYSKLADLKGAVLALVDPSSTSGSGVPKALFPDAVKGEAVEQYFGRVFYAGAHDAAAKAVLAGRADASFVSDNALSRGIDRGVFKLDSFDVLWTSPKIPTLPIAVNSQKVPKEMVSKLQTILSEMKDNERGRAMLAQLNVTDLPVASDGMFDALRRVLGHKTSAK